MQLVAPRAVRIADAIDAMICTIHFRVSFLVIAYLLPYYWFYALPEFSGRCHPSAATAPSLRIPNGKG